MIIVIVSGCMPDINQLLPFQGAFYSLICRRAMPYANALPLSEDVQQAL